MNLTSRKKIGERPQKRHWKSAWPVVIYCAQINYGSILTMRSNKSNASVNHQCDFLVKPESQTLSRQKPLAYPSLIPELLSAYLSIASFNKPKW
jgi:hypothetical protein